MKGLIITNKGFEQVSGLEVKELINKESTIEDSVVLFDAEPKDLCMLCYKSQSAIKILALIDSFSFKTKEDIAKNAKKLDFSEWISKDTKFSVRCKRIGEHNFSSAEIEQEVGNNINGKVDLDNPEIPVIVYIYHNKCYIGIDFAGLDLSKRQHKVFPSAGSLKGTVAYGLLRISDFKKDETILDPFCSDGMVPIEAGLFATNFPVNYYNKENFGFLKFKIFEKEDFDKFFEEIDKQIEKKNTNVYGYDALLPHFSAAKKNAKISGILKQINLSKIDVEWLDTKLDKGSVDKIVTNPPTVTDYNKPNMIKLLKELFYQSDFILKKEGTITIITRKSEDIKKCAEEKGFKVLKTLEVEQGKEKLEVLIFGRCK